MAGMLIGEVAKRSGVSAPTIRFYEQMSLLTKPRRSKGGYRQYAEAVLDQLRFIQLAQAAGLSLPELRPLMRWMASRRRPPLSVIREARHHVEAVMARQLELKKFRACLRATVAAKWPQPVIHTRK